MIYFDNSATTKPSRRCIEAMTSAMETRFANASSLHRAGIAAKRDLDDCKAALASALKCTANEILIGPGGTYCNNLALYSGANVMKRRANKVLISSIEHPSVAQAAAKLSDAGFEVKECNPLSNDFENEIDGNTALVSCMYINNETGLILPVREIAEAIKKKSSPALLHIDAVQAFGKRDIDLRRLDCDMMTVSAHKINGPKGIGALYVKKGLRVLPITFGGEQENGIIPGTYNSPAAAGFAAAVKELDGCRKNHYADLYTHFFKRLSEFDFIKPNTFGIHAPHIINVSFDGYLGENVLHFLESHDIYTSQGSACSSHSKQKGKTLAALGCSKRVIDGSLRISFDRNNTIEQIDEFFDVCSEIPSNLIRAYR